MSTENDERQKAEADAARRKEREDLAEKNKPKPQE
jgi:hypothetical protein